MKDPKEYLRNGQFELAEVYEKLHYILDKFESEMDDVYLLSIIYKSLRELTEYESNNATGLASSRAGDGFSTYKERHYHYDSSS